MAQNWQLLRANGESISDEMIRMLNNLEQAGSGVNPATLPKGIYQGGNVSCANNATTNLTLTTQTSGDDLLDLTTPTNPKVRTAGIYACHATYWVAAMTAGAQYQPTLILDSPTGPGITVVSPAATTGFTQPNPSITIIWYIPANGIILNTIWNGDTARNYRINQLIIQKLA